MTSIAFIAPYANLASLAREICAGQHADVIVCEGLLEEGVACARQAAAAGCQVIVSRGGTANLIQTTTAIPVVEVRVTGYDILRTLSEFSGSTKTIGVIGYRNVVEGCRSISEILKLKSIELLAVNSTESPDWQAVQVKLGEQLRRNPVDVLVGDSLIVGKLSLNVPEVKLIMSGKEAISEAIAEARRIAHVKIEEKKSAEQLRTILNFIHDGVLAVDRDGNITVINPKAATIFKIDAAQAVGKPVDQFITNTKMLKTLQSGQAELDQLQHTPHGIIVTNRVPIQVDGEVMGAVATLQETDRIQAAEQKIRTKLYAKGLFAKYNFDDIMAWDSEMQRVIDQASRFAMTDGTILIQAESGCGKELFAQSIHRASPREIGPFVAVNCAALPTNLLESELFGYTEGAFTGARKGGKIGLLELAHGGTLFLDEIGDMEHNLQARLLRVLEERQVMRLGSDNWIAVDIRIIAATNLPLKKRVADGQFRMDLFYRLNVLTIAIPPLRQRKNDIYPLANYFLQIFTKKHNRPKMDLPEDLHSILTHYSWPGNVRELRNIMERMVLTFEQTDNYRDSLLNLLKDHDDESIKFLSEASDKPDLPANNRTPALSGNPSAMPSMKDMKHLLAINTLESCNGNKSQAAKQLGITRFTLDRLLKKKLP